MKNIIFTPIEKEELKENGDVNIKLYFKNKQFQTDLTTVNLINIHDNIMSIYMVKKLLIVF